MTAWLWYFFTNPEDPAPCALEISHAITDSSVLPLRLGIHSGPVSSSTDVNGQPNVAGVGINTTQRVMDCGDAGHILLSARVAYDLSHFARWAPLRLNPMFDSLRKDPRFQALSARNPAAHARNR